MRRMPAFAMVVVLLLSPPGRAVAQPDSADPNTLADLIVAVAEAEQDVQALGASIQARREGVNKAIVEVQSAQKAAEAAKSTLEGRQRSLADSTNAIAAAQQRFDEFAAAAYVHGPPASYLSAAGPEDLISAGAYGRALTLGFEHAQSYLQKARTERLNRESAARSAQQEADQAVADAKRRQDDAVAALADAQQGFVAQQSELSRLVAERDAARARLAALSAADRDFAWSLTPPALPIAFLSGDPASVIAAILQMSGNSEQITAEMGRNFLAKIGFYTPADSGINNGRIPAAYGRQASELVIMRALSQIGVPYSWGGGTAAGPTLGFDAGAHTVGFDCSGLILWAFAGVGILLPHYSGYQYLAGRRVPSSQVRRGDVIFYGPGGSQHVALYLGNGQMLEAPDTGSVVEISAVRTSGMTPYVVRYIEY